MDDMLEQALALAASGYHVFPLTDGSKLPLIDSWQHKATRDPDAILAWWVDPVMGWQQPHNIGVCTTRFGDDQALIVVDVDNKDGRDGDGTVVAMELDGRYLPATREIRTPTGGRHLYYTAPEPGRSGAAVLGVGVDIRSGGGFVVGPGSRVEAGTYTVIRHGDPIAAPDWLVDRVRRGADRGDRLPAVQGAEVPIERALARATEYLTTLPAVGSGVRNDSAYRVATHLKDMGVRHSEMAAIMFDHWPCEPMLDPEELQDVVDNAFSYGKYAPGSSAPETQFPVVVESQQELVGSPLDRMNQEFALVMLGGGAGVIWETNDDTESPETRVLSLPALHARFANRHLSVGKRTVPVSQAWMEWPQRRTYDGIVFAPQRPVAARFYNLWRGFAFTAADTPENPGVSAWLEHLFVNVCNQDQKLADWLIGYFAHIVQRPWEKPLTALVFKGGKGVGKNALVDRVAALLGKHARTVANRRYLLGNFNSHLENCLMLTMDEAFWSGEKSADGIIKDLITGSHHVIERKGQEPYSVANLTRPIIIGNEDWLVPASADERRYAVFTVGEGRKQDNKFFERMRLDMEAGGYSNLLRFLLNAPVCEVNRAPVTAGLLEQKLQSLHAATEWWFESLREGRLLRSDYDGWPETAARQRVMEAVQRYARERTGGRAWTPSMVVLGKKLHEVCPDLGSTQRPDGCREYVLPPLDQCRAAFEKYIGSEVKW